jgi:hypothetical protein
MSDLAERLDALASRGIALRKLSQPLFLSGVCVCFVAYSLVWPDKDATGTLASTLMLAPADLAVSLENSGAYIGERSAGEMLPADQLVRLQFGLLPIALLLLWRGAGFFIKSWAARAVMLSVAWPILLVVIGHVVSSGPRVATLHVGQVSELAGQTLSAEDQAWLRARSRNRQAPEFALYLEPLRMSAILGDQARFVLAQQAYHEKRPDAVASQLRSLSGAWRPTDILTTTIVGVLSDYAQANRYPIGHLATDIAAGPPYQELRLPITAWCMRLGALLLVVGLVVDVIGVRRVLAAKRLRAAWTAFASVATSVGERPRSFGRRKPDAGPALP